MAYDSVQLAAEASMNDLIVARELVRRLTTGPSPYLKPGQVFDQYSDRWWLDKLGVGRDVRIMSGEDLLAVPKALLTSGSTFATVSQRNPSFRTPSVPNPVDHKSPTQFTSNILSFSYRPPTFEHG